MQCKCSFAIRKCLPNEFADNYISSWSNHKTHPWADLVLHKKVLVFKKYYMKLKVSFEMFFWWLQISPKKRLFFKKFKIRCTYVDDQLLTSHPSIFWWNHSIIIPCFYWTPYLKTDGTSLFILFFITDPKPGSMKIIMEGVSTIKSLAVNCLG